MPARLAFLLFAAGLIQAAYAGAPDCLRFELRKAVVDTALRDFRPAMTPEDRAKFQQVFSDNAIPESRKAEEAFMVYLEARIRKNQDAYRVRRVVRDAKFLMNPHEAQGGFGVGGRGRMVKMFVRLPKEFLGSTISFAMLAHETEHAAQYYFYREKRVDAEVLDRLAYVNGGGAIESRIRHFLKDFQSMSAEWEYLNAVPKEVRDRLSQTVRDHPTLKVHYKNLLLAALRDSDGPLIDFLAEQWRQNRYGPGNFGIPEALEYKRLFARCLDWIQGKGDGLSSVMNECKIIY